MRELYQEKGNTLFLNLVRPTLFWHSVGDNNYDVRRLERVYIYLTKAKTPNFVPIFTCNQPWPIRNPHLDTVGDSLTLKLFFLFRGLNRACAQL
ncbi:hypothetical protein EUGRSUZ_I02224 [Eucalyptus grandis]|uniref:Uncharacterized protein n=2 Tax=Eucalyptus grandis TaxID=71139 RepID=A0ACC3JJI4_EUCGR|nr:hypothetical protein EUGRSUZ_I02224 [Eucalyptus grandis]